LELLVFDTKMTKHMNRRGFTLLELILAIAIVSVLTVMTIAGFSQGNKTRSVVLGTDTVISSIRTAQAASLSPQQVSTINCSSGNIPKEYHLKFDANSSDYNFIAKDKCDNLVTLQTFKLPSSVQIQSSGLQVDGVSVGSGGGNIDIKFVPPFGSMSVSLNGGSYQPFGQTTVTLQSVDGSVARNVVLDGISGRVDTNSIVGSAIPDAPVPSILFSASPTSISTGQSSTLTWSVTNANSISVDNGIGGVSATGSATVSPTTTTTYTITASYNGGTVTSQAVVTVSNSDCAGTYTESESYPAGTPVAMPNISGGAAPALTSETPTGISTHTGYLRISGLPASFNSTAANNTVVFMPSNGLYYTAVADDIVVVNPSLSTLYVTVPDGIPVGDTPIRVVNMVTHKYADGVSFKMVHLTLPNTRTGQVGQNGVVIRVNSSFGYFTSSTLFTFTSSVSLISKSILSSTSADLTVNISGSALTGRVGVRAVDTGADAIVLNSFGICASAPGTPNLTATGQTGKVHLSFGTVITGGSPITNYKIYRGNSSGSESLLTTVGNVGTYDDPIAASGYSGGTVIDDPSEMDDGYNRVVQDTNYLYIVGTYRDLNPPINCTGQSSCGSFIEKRSKATGDVVTTFGTNGYISCPQVCNQNFNSLTVDSTSMYIGGSHLNCPGEYDICYTVEKRSLATGALDNTFGTNGKIEYQIPYRQSGIIFAMNTDANYLYISGDINNPLDPISSPWCQYCNLVEKRNKTTGALITTFGNNGRLYVNPNTTDKWADYINKIVLDANNIYLIGQNAGSGGSCRDACWYMEKRSITTGALVTAFDTDGILQIDPSNINDAIAGAAVDASYLYLAGWQSAGSGCTGGCWRIEKRNITTGALISAFGSSGVIVDNPTSTFDKLTAIAIDSSYMYLGGYQNILTTAPNGNTWRYEKRNITTGALISAFGSSGVVTSSNIDINGQSGTDDNQMYDLVIDSSFIYGAGMIERLNGPPSGNAREGRTRLERRNITTGALNGSGSNSTFYYKVSAVNAVGEGPQSAEASATPQ
jgi:prepilin-type N-terminal cleavage/methylation domain-containing protein